MVWGGCISTEILKLVYWHWHGVSCIYWHWAFCNLYLYARLLRRWKSGDSGCKQWPGDPRWANHSLALLQFLLPVGDNAMHSNNAPAFVMQLCILSSQCSSTTSKRIGSLQLVQFSDFHSGFTRRPFQIILSKVQLKNVIFKDSSLYPSWSKHISIMFMKILNWIGLMQSSKIF